MICNYKICRVFIFKLSSINPICNETATGEKRISLIENGLLHLKIWRYFLVCKGINKFVFEQIADGTEIAHQPFVVCYRIQLCHRHIRMTAQLILMEIVKIDFSDSRCVDGELRIKIGIGLRWQALDFTQLLNRIESA